MEYSTLYRTEFANHEVTKTRCEQLQSRLEDSLRECERLRGILQQNAADFSSLRDENNRLRERVKLLELSHSPTSEGDLTVEQLQGMEMWDRDVMLAPEYRAVGSMLVRAAITEIRRRRNAGQMLDCLRQLRPDSSWTTMTPDQRLEWLSQHECCRGCGVLDTRCQCQNDA